MMMIACGVVIVIAAAERERCELLFLAGLHSPFLPPSLDVHLLINYRIDI